MNEHLKNLVNLIRMGENDKFNPETYFNNHLNVEDGILNSQYVLGNLYAKGYSNSAGVNFEIFKDHCTWQVWVWKFDAMKKEMHQFSAPYYKYDDVIEFFKTL